jgi:hypothetical protein
MTATTTATTTTSTQSLWTTTKDTTINERHNYGTVYLAFYFFYIDSIVFIRSSSLHELLSLFLAIFVFSSLDLATLKNVKDAQLAQTYARWGRIFDMVL